MTRWTHVLYLLGLLSFTLAFTFSDKITSTKLSFASDGLTIPARDAINTYNINDAFKTFDFFVVQNDKSEVAVIGHDDRSNDAVFKMAFPADTKDFCHFVGYTKRGETYTMYASARATYSTEYSCLLYSAEVGGNTLFTQVVPAPTTEAVTTTTAEPTPTPTKQERRVKDVSEFHLLDYIRHSRDADDHASITVAVFDAADQTAKILKIENGKQTLTPLPDCKTDKGEVSFPFSKAHDNNLLIICDSKNAATSTTENILYNYDLVKSELSPTTKSCSGTGTSGSLMHSCLFIHDQSIYVADPDHCNIVGTKFSSDKQDHDFEMHVMKEISFHKDSLVFFNVFGDIWKTDGKDLTKITSAKPASWLTVQKVDTTEQIFVDAQDYSAIYTIPEPLTTTTQIIDSKEGETVEFIAALGSKTYLIEKCASAKDCTVVVESREGMHEEPLINKEASEVIEDTEVFYINFDHLPMISLELLVKPKGKSAELHKLEIDTTKFLPTVEPTPTTVTTTTAAPTPTPAPATEYTCNNVSSTNPQVCYGHGKCVGTDVCKCDNHYTGKYCSDTTCFNIPKGAAEVCSSKGDCVDFNICKCQEGYEGYDCSVQNTSHGLYIAVITMTVFSGFCVLFLLAVITYLYYRKPRPTVSSFDDEDNPAFGMHRLHDEDEDEDNLLEMEEKEHQTRSDTPTTPVDRNAGKSYSLNDDSDEDLDIRV